MHSFRTELENPVVEKDIIELEKKIHAFRNGVMDEDRFRSLRLARGIYGQRQEGVQMVRIKMPLGQCSTVQLRKLADVSDRYSTGNLHITTRQDIQIHYVSLDKTPQLWTELEESKITLREACGNTVRNITASPFAGVDPEEAFDVSPYAKAMFEYFLRNPVCQDMGRKFKIAFSSSDKDDAYTFAHDLGFIPKIAEDIRGFRVVVGGGIGSQPRHADLLYDFLPSDQIIPLTEAVLRVFDRYGERLRRHKARLKFLIDDEGLDTFKKWVDEQSTSMPYHSYPVAVVDEGDDQPPGSGNIFIEDNSMNENYSNWLKFNVFTQKQPGFVAVGIKIPTGDFSSEQARKLAGLMDR
ncbi:MAG TPA: nitrite/sulfite reductase, partial [Saprospiraceae bacterium]|nr:nitrite/sulfite reductase [Saprospiraceae bacterium]